MLLGNGIAGQGQGWSGWNKPVQNKAAPKRMASLAPAAVGHPWPSEPLTGRPQLSSAVRGESRAGPVSATRRLNGCPGPPKHEPSDGVQLLRRFKSTVRPACPTRHPPRAPLPSTCGRLGFDLAGSAGCSFGTSAPELSDASASGSSGWLAAGEETVGIGGSPSMRVPATRRLVRHMSSLSLFCWALLGWTLA